MKVFLCLCNSYEIGDWLEFISDGWLWILGSICFTTLTICFAKRSIRRKKIVNFAFFAISCLMVVTCYSKTGCLFVLNGLSSESAECANCAIRTLDGIYDFPTVLYLLKDTTGKDCETTGKRICNENKKYYLIRLACSKLNPFDTSRAKELEDTATLLGFINPSLFVEGREKHILNELRQVSMSKTDDVGFWWIDARRMVQYCMEKRLPARLFLEDMDCE